MRVPFPFGEAAVRVYLSLVVLLGVAFDLRAADEPKIVREEIEWLDVWVPGHSKKDLPKILLIGDSICKGYYNDVNNALKEKATLCRLATSKSLGDPGFLLEVSLVLSQTKFDVVHVNNGLHGWGYSEEEYAKALPELLAVIRKHAPKAKIVWANTTPMRIADKLDTLHEKNDRVKARNALAAKIMEAEKIETTDLFGAVADKPEFYSRDGVHFNTKGNAALAERVIASLKK